MYRIFIVEDDDIISDSIADMLRSWGFEAISLSGLQRRALPDHSLLCEPHLVLMDISLPFFNGYHWCARSERYPKSLSCSYRRPETT